MPERVTMMNRSRQSAEVIVRQGENMRKETQGLAAICHKVERRTHMEAAVLNDTYDHVGTLEEGPNNSRNPK
jgi:hypothetical protein